jgi:hypothetical protein
VLEKLALQSMVDRHLDRAEEADAEPYLEVLPAIADDDSDRVSLAHAQLLERTAKKPSPLGHLPIGQLTIREEYQDLVPTIGGPGLEERR